MKVTTVTVEYGRTINTGNYSSAKYSCTLTADVGEDPPGRVMAELWAEVIAQVREMARTTSQ